MEDLLTPKQKEDILPLKDIVGAYFQTVFYLCEENLVEAARLMQISIRTARNYRNRFKVERKIQPLYNNDAGKYTSKHLNCKIKEDFGYRDVTPEERDEWYNRDRF